MRMRAVVVAALILGALVVQFVSAQQAEKRSADADWPTYNRDLAGTRYSPLTQIDTTNVARLVQAWSYRLRPEPGRPVPAIDTCNPADFFASRRFTRLRARRSPIDSQHSFQNDIRTAGRHRRQDSCGREPP
jgi:hypothetical protein